MKRQDFFLPFFLFYRQSASPVECSFAAGFSNSTGPALWNAALLLVFSNSTGPAKPTCHAVANDEG
ncbi:MAG: hypothetical protein K9N09_10495 [Candidatus Cloacimonetes bacterium]|nr:hypothetical protein [Candidatus Cloacimonadota bacterium]MCF7869121.1 hypothetical protein [Candidatus Cloacimonadota bacterium]